MRLLFPLLLVTLSAVAAPSLAATTSVFGQFVPSTTPPSVAAPPSTSTNPAIIDNATAEVLAAQDPVFQRFQQIVEQCGNTMLGTASMTPDQCVASMQAGADRWCGLEFYDAQKCQHASEWVRLFSRLNNVLGSYGLDKIPSLDQLLAIPSSP
jgi:hypothetical protein